MWRFSSPHEPNLTQPILLLLLLLLLATTEAQPPPPPPPGANSLCPTAPSHPRLRHDWDLLPPASRELFLSAIERSIDLNLYQRFLLYHSDLPTSIQSHETCAFPLWHRRFLLAFENMLRDIDYPKYACLTIPWWNVMEHYRDYERGLCDSYASCVPVVNQLGGTPVDFEEVRVYDGIEGIGAAFGGRPIGGLLDDGGRVGVVRDDLLCVALPDSCAYGRVVGLYGGDDGAEGGSYVDFARALQRGIHDDVHDTIGGMMPTYASPADPLFFVWHSFIDLVLYLWEVCRVDHEEAQNIFASSSRSTTTQSASFFDPFEGDYETCTFTNRAAEMFPITNATSEMYMRSNTTDIRDDPLIGKYFRDIGLEFGEVASVRSLGENEFAYEDLTPPLWEDLLSDTSGKCPKGGWYTQSPTQSPVSTGPTIPRDLDAFGEWISSLRNDLEDLYPDDAQRVEGYIRFVQCQNSDRMVPDEEGLYREKLLEGDVSDARCNFWLPAGPLDGGDGGGGGGGTVVVVGGGGGGGGSGAASLPKTIEIQWFIPNFDEEDAYPDRRVSVGDTVVFLWEGDHNVYIHPTLDCEMDGRVFVGDGGGEEDDEGGKNATYTFGDSDIGKTVVFACDVERHCSFGQIARFMVTDRIDEPDNGVEENGHSHDNDALSSSTDAVGVSEDDKDGSDAWRRIDRGGYWWIGTIVSFLI